MESSRKDYFDREALAESGFTKEGQERIYDETDGIGVLKSVKQRKRRVQHYDSEGRPTHATYSWDPREFRYRDRKTGEWEKASDSDIDKVLFGSKGTE